MDAFVQLARDAVESYVKDHRIMTVPEAISKELLERKAGVFVTILKEGELRGCTGTMISDKENVAVETIANAISACSKDGRFEPVAEDELSTLTYKVSILNKPQRVQDLSIHDPRTHGIIVKASDGRLGLLLPALEGIDTTEQQIAIAAQKGGIDITEDDIEYEEFSVEKHV